jgi:pyruvoyl-dependent arginine decarboxylase
MEPTKTQGIVYPFASLGHGINDLDAFDDAEVQAGIEALNAIKYTSFVPVGPQGRWKVDDNSELPKLIKRGDALPMPFEHVYSASDYVSAAIAIGLNEDQMKPGLIMEYAQTNISEEDLERLAIESLERTFERRRHLGWKLDSIVTKKITGNPKPNLVSCALVGAIYIPEEYLPGIGRT